MVVSWASGITNAINRRTTFPLVLTWYRDMRQPLALRVKWSDWQIRKSIQQASHLTAKICACVVRQTWLPSVARHYWNVCRLLPQMSHHKFSAESLSIHRPFPFRGMRPGENRHIKNKYVNLTTTAMEVSWTEWQTKGKEDLRLAGRCKPDCLSVCLRPLEFTTKRAAVHFS